MVELNKKRTIKIKEKLKKIPIWKLSIFLGELETSILNDKKQRISSNSGQLKKRRCIRGMYRRELLRKLKEWESGKEEGIEYSDVNKLDLIDEQINVEEVTITK